MKNTLKILAAFVLAYIIALFRFAACSAWAWLPIVFDLNNFFGGAGLGFVISIVIFIGEEILYHKFICD